MEVQDYLKVLQARWKIIAVVTVVAILGALGASLISTPIYQASTRLFVSTTLGSSVNEAYQGNLAVTAASYVVHQAPDRTNPRTAHYRSAR